MSFRDDFAWGTATAAYQVEGGHDAGGRGPSVWDMLCRRPGAVFEGHTGDVACDMFHRYEEDIQLIKNLGTKHYRLSLSWSRLLPDGTGKVNEAGVDFYNKLIDGLIAAGVTPWVTLFHWDYPLALYHRGGWLNRESVDWFRQYARLVAERFGDRVDRWMTHNEPQCFVSLGHNVGVHAPGLKMNRSEVLRINHHALMAHGAAVQELRDKCKKTPTIGWAPVGDVTYPLEENGDCIEQAKKRMFGIDLSAQGGFWNNVLYSDPALRGEYPQAAHDAFGDDMPDVHDGDMQLMHQPIDFYGVNIYSGASVDAEGRVATNREAGGPRTHIGWPVEPRALYWGPKLLGERYGLPTVLTENGLASHDWVMRDGRVHDGHRVDFLGRYLSELKRAAADGVDVRGYFQWSLMDNFEWAEGYKYRFGLIHVDYQTLKRTPKDSYYWYKQVVASNGATIPESFDGTYD